MFQLFMIVKVSDPDFSVCDYHKEETYFLIVQGIVWIPSAAPNRALIQICCAPVLHWQATGFCDAQHMARGLVHVLATI